MQRATLKGNGSGKLASRSEEGGSWSRDRMFRETTVVNFLERRTFWSGKKEEKTLGIAVQLRTHNNNGGFKGEG